MSPGRFICERLDRHTQIGQDIGPGSNFVTRPFEILANGLAGAAQMPCKERFGNCEMGELVRRPLESVSLIGIDDVGHRNVPGPHGGDDGVALCDLAANVVGAMKDQHGLRDVVDLVDR